MTKDELVTKQQLEIEALKERLKNYKTGVDSALLGLCFIEQWSPKCPDFPGVAMDNVLQARDALRDI